MEASVTVFSDLFDRIRAWIPHRPEPSSTREFWMPDRICRKCYDCDSQFTIFNRRHHCRICGKVFCGNCSVNTIPVAVEGYNGVHEEGDRVRVCNYCYKVSRQGNAHAVSQTEPELDRDTPPMTPRSAASHALLGMDMNGSAAAAHLRMSQRPPPSSSSASRASSSSRPPGVDDKNTKLLIPASYAAMPGEEQPSSPPTTYGNRSDDEDDYFNKEQDYEDSRYARLADLAVMQGEDYEDDSVVDLELTDNPPPNQSSKYSSHSSDGQTVPAEDMDNSVARGMDVRRKGSGSRVVAEAGQLLQSSRSRKSMDDMDAYEGDSSPLYIADYEGEKPVDYENNILLWDPPLPEEEDADVATSMVDDEEDEDEEEEAGWGLSRSVGSMSSSDFKIREKAALRDLVDGHFRALVAKLLEGSGMKVSEEDDDPDSWLSIVTSLALQAASLVKPDRAGGAMDPGNYVKVKCLAFGNRIDSYVVKGVVCRKNVHNKRMMSRYRNPRILLLGGALEYQRVSNQLSSIETLLQQEIAHIKMTVDRIEQHHPNVLLVEKTVSGHAQELLLNKDISLVLNVKRRVMDRIARCTGAQIFQSSESLMIPKAGHCGHCELFHVDKYVEELGSAGSVGEKKTKTWMFFEDCPRPVGCTILLRGENGDLLKKVKAVVQYAVFAAYHLALETSFLADEGATLPDIPLPGSIAIPNNQGNLQRSISCVPSFALPGQIQIPADAQSNHTRSVASTSASVSPIPPGFPGTASTWISYGRPSVLPSAASSRISSVVNSPGTSPGQITTVGFNSRSGRANNVNNGAAAESGSGQPAHNMSGLSTSLRQGGQREGTSPLAVTIISRVPGATGFEAVASSLLPNGSYSTSIVHDAGTDGLRAANASGSTVEQGLMPNGISHNPSLASMDGQNALQNWEAEVQDGKEDFPPSPSDHQNILVSTSSRCLRKGTVCERPHLFRIKYYGISDKPLGRYLRETLFDASKCRSCDEPLDAHIHCFTHRQGSLTISMRRLHDKPPLTGEKEGKIWMWHRCLKCPREDGVPPATRRLVMSDAAWGLSFGKFLELSFSNHAAASRVAACGHSLHRDCLRFYGFGNAIACFRYAPIILNAVHVPPAQLEFNDPRRQEWLQQELNEIGEKGELVFAEVFDTLRVFGERIANSGSLSAGDKGSEARKRVNELEGMAQIHKADFEEALQKAGPREPQPGQPIADVLELNRLRRVLLECAIYWDTQFNKLIANLRSKKATVPEASLSSDSSQKLVKQSVGGLSGKSLWSQDGEVDSEASGIALSRSQSRGDSSGIVNNGMNGDKVSEKDGPDSHSGPLPTSSVAGGTPVSATTGDVDTAEVNTGLVGSTNVGDIVVESVVPIHDEKTGGAPGTPHEHVTVSEDTAEAALEKKDEITMTEEAAAGKSVVDENLLFQAPPPALGTEIADCVRTEEAVVKPQEPGTQSGRASAEDVSKVDGGITAQQKELSEPEAALQTAPVSPTKSTLGSADREFSTPFLHLYRSNSRTSSSISGSPPRGEVRRPPSHSTICKSAADGGARVLLPPGRDNIIIAIYDDEPTTIIAYALVSEEYHRELKKDMGLPLSGFSDGSVPHSMQSADGSGDTIDLSAGGDPLLNTEAMHILTQFEDGTGPGKMKYSVRSYFARHFDALRKKCCEGDLYYLKSLSRCRKWGAQGGKSNVFFAKTADDRFVVKQVTRTESVSFRDFALEYFKYLSEYIDSGSPTCLAKILGLYQVTVKKAGKEIQKMDLLVMENLLYGRTLSRIYDLKGSVRSRYTTDSGSNTVLLDQNLLESMPTAPIFVSNKAKRLLERAVWNDTAFLATVQVMDYSLLVGIDEERQELAIGIIDFIRQYTWDKQLETWVKASGILGGPKNAAPTVISPKQYKKRFRKAMSTYFLMVPDQCWSPPMIAAPPPASSEDFGNGRMLQDEAEENGARH